MNFGRWLQLLLIYLKLTKQIDWNWMLILMPMMVDLTVAGMRGYRGNNKSVSKKPSTEQTERTE